MRVSHTKYEWIQRMCVGDLSDTMHIMGYYGYFAFFLSEKNIFVSDFKTVHRIDSRYSGSNKCQIWE